MIRSGLRQCPRVRNRKSLQTGHGSPQTGELVAGEQCRTQDVGRCRLVDGAVWHPGCCNPSKPLNPGI